MSWLNNDPDCPANCTDTSTPEVEFSDCAPVINAAQITDVFVTNPGNPLANWNDPAEWAARVSNTDPAASAIRRWTVIGSKPIPEATEKKISHDRIIKGAKNHSLNLKVDETNDTNYENIVRNSECGGQKVMWFLTSGGKLYGGNAGIECTISMDDEIVEDIEDIERFVGTAKWSAKYSPERITSPIS